MSRVPQLIRAPEQRVGARHITDRPRPADLADVAVGERAGGEAPPDRPRRPGRRAESRRHEWSFGVIHAPSCVAGVVTPPAAIASIIAPVSDCSVTPGASSDARRLERPLGDAERPSQHGDLVGAS